MGEWKYPIDYFSPFPTMFALQKMDGADAAFELDTMYMCERCLAYTMIKEALHAHLNVCKETQPPGTLVEFDSTGLNLNEDEKLVLYKVAGSREKTYVQNWCLLAKCFIDHKTIIVNCGNNFDYYILCKMDAYGPHPVGYFSRPEKCMSNADNVNCLMILPPYRRMGYASKLIEVSYSISRAEGRLAGPERPFSEEGKAVYEKYWNQLVAATLAKKPVQFNPLHSFEDLCAETGMIAGDILDTLFRIGRVTSEQLSATKCKLVADRMAQWKVSIGEKTKLDRLRWYTGLTPADTIQSLVSLGFAEKVSDEVYEAKGFAEAQSAKIPPESSVVAASNNNESAPIEAAEEEPIEDMKFEFFVDEEDDFEWKGFLGEDAFHRAASDAFGRLFLRRDVPASIDMTPSFNMTDRVLEVYATTNQAVEYMRKNWPSTSNGYKIAYNRAKPIDRECKKKTYVTFSSKILKNK